MTTRKSLSRHSTQKQGGPGHYVNNQNGNMSGDGPYECKCPKLMVILLSLGYSPCSIKQHPLSRHAFLTPTDSPGPE